MWKEEIPSISREALIDASEDGDEVGLERSDCSFSFVASVHVWRYFLELTFPDFCDVAEELLTDLVVHDLHVHSESSRFEAAHDGIICWDAMMICFCFEGLYEDDVCGIMECNHDVLVSTLCTDGESAHVVGVEG